MGWSWSGSLRQFVLMIRYTWREVTKLNKTKLIRRENEELVDIKLWDGYWISGRHALYCKKDAVVVVYDVSNRESFDCLPSQFLPERVEHCRQGVVKILLGNKKDL